MSKIEKLIERLKSKPTELRFSEVERVMAHYGATKMAKRGRGSHNVFRLSGKGSLTIPTRSGSTKVAGIYAQSILEFLGIEE